MNFLNYEDMTIYIENKKIAILSLYLIIILSIIVLNYFYQKRNKNDETKKNTLFSLWDLLRKSQFAKSKRKKNFAGGKLNHNNIYAEFLKEYLMLHVFDIMYGVHVDEVDHFISTNFKHISDVHEFIKHFKNT